MQTNKNEVLCYYFVKVLKLVHIAYMCCDFVFTEHRDDQVESNSRLPSNEQHSSLRTDQQSQSNQQQSSSSSSLQSAPPTSIPPPAVIHAVPPPPLPNQVLPNMVSVLPPGAVIPGLPAFNTNQLKHLPPPPLVSTHVPPPLLSPGGGLVPPTHAQNAALVKQEQVR